MSTQHYQHTFHIPVMGLAYTIDAPIKVARFGISSVISIIEDELIEKMRKYHSAQFGEVYIPISKDEPDSRAKRITEYLNLVNRIVNFQTEQLKHLEFESGSELDKYFMMLPENSAVRLRYLKMLVETDLNEKKNQQADLRGLIKSGSIDVNIMSKVDRTNYDKDGIELPPEYSDALSSLRGFALSELNSAVVFSAGYNPRLYAYIENFSDFFPDANGNLKKKIILKVSDYRSAIVQGKILAKKGLWISEFRIESGLNCGGHAFATDGVLMGPILEEFKQRKNEIINELFEICNAVLLKKEGHVFHNIPEMKITVQGGIGTHNEDAFLLDYYQVNGTGWGSPFLLVPEVTNVDDDTLHQLETAKQSDYYLSNASPLGIPFNNLRNSSGDVDRKLKIDKGRPGSPCYKKFLSSNTEFTPLPICTASRQYEDLKIKQLKNLQLSDMEFEKEMKEITAKECLCEGLGASALLKNEIPVDHGLKAVSICPGPNLAYFSGIFTLQQMVDHIYGRINLLNKIKRPNMFVNELKLYVDYLNNEIQKNLKVVSDKQNRYYDSFKSNLLKGIEYYKNLSQEFRHETEEYISEFKSNLLNLEAEILKMQMPQPLLAI